MNIAGRVGQTLAIAATLVLAPAISFADFIEVELEPVEVNIFEGELTDDDANFLATDSFGSFWFDLIRVTVAGSNPVTITLDSSDFAPYLAWGYAMDIPPWPAGSDEPYSDFRDQFCLDAPGSDSLVFNNAQPGRRINVFVATCFYNPTPLGAYSLTFETEIDVVGVPEPGSLLLMGLGLVGLAAARRRKQRT